MCIYFVLTVPGFYWWPAALPDDRVDMRSACLRGSFSAPAELPAGALRQNLLKSIVPATYFQAHRFFLFATCALERRFGDVYMADMSVLQKYKY